LASLAGAAAVIAGVRSLSVQVYREAFPLLAVGASTHTVEEATAAVAAGAHFLFFGPVWDTPEKSGILEPRGLRRLAEVVALGVPVIAIGGIERPLQVGQVLDVGAHGAAVLRAARGAETKKPLGGILWPHPGAWSALHQPSWRIPVVPAETTGILIRREGLHRLVVERSRELLA
jgi:thiamine monophosphate synthase